MSAPAAAATGTPAPRTTDPTPVQVRGGDGVLLRGLIARSASPRGTVVVQTPYDAWAHEVFARGWAGAGWSCVVMDVRGRYRSGGLWEAYGDESQDGLLLLRGLLDSGALGARESESLVLAGASYAGMCALATARRATRDDPAVAERLRGLVLTVPVTGAWESAHDPSGLPRLRQRLGWWSTHGWSRRSGTGPGAETLERWAQHHGRSGDLPYVLARLGAADHVARAWARMWRAQTTINSDIALPLMVVSGAHDHFSAEAEDLVRTWSPQAPAVLISGPWDHTLQVRHQPGPWEDIKAVRSTVKAAGPMGARAVRWLQHLDRQPAAGVSYRTLDTGGTSWHVSGHEGAGAPVAVHARLATLPADVPLDLPDDGHASGTTLWVDLDVPTLVRGVPAPGASWVVCEVHELRDGHRRTLLRRSLPLVAARVRGELHGLRMRLQPSSRALLHVRGPTAFR